MRCLQKNTMTSFSFAYKSHERIFVKWLIVEKPSEKLSERVQWWATLRHCKHVLTRVFFYWISNFSQAIVIFSIVNPDNLLCFSRTFPTTSQTSYTLSDFGNIDRVVSLKFRATCILVQIHNFRIWRLDFFPPKEDTFPNCALKKLAATLHFITINWSAHQRVYQNEAALLF